MLDLLDRHRQPSTGQRLAWLAAGAALGAGVGYLASRGASRRAELKQRGAQLVGSVADTARSLLSEDDPAVSGAADELTPDLKDPSDAVLLERVRSDAIGHSEVRNSAVVTTVEGGVVTVRGQVDREEQRADLLARIREVEGVEDVVDRLHLPHQPAPTRS